MDKKLILGIVAVVLLVCTVAGSGCTSFEPIAGSWEKQDAIDTGIFADVIKEWYMFNGDGTFSLVIKLGSTVKYTPSKWEKVSNNHYRSTNKNFNFYLSDDGNTLNVKWYNSDNKLVNDVYKRIDSSRVPKSTV